tara:strand:+ start:111 stop:281 length:171 start_codon:yes stop_codon:yes gene_type:complete
MEEPYDAKNESSIFYFISIKWIWMPEESDGKRFISTDRDICASAIQRMCCTLQNMF